MEQNIDQPIARRKKKLNLKKLNPLLWITVIIPTFCSIFYFSIWASDVYISESSFIVRSSRSQASLGGMGALLQSIGFARSQDDTFTVQEFMRSRNALSTLETDLPLRKYYDEGDFFSRFDPLGLFDSQEAFYQYFRDHLSISIDSLSGIATLRVRTFDAASAQEINHALLNLAEKLVNQLNDRARRDTIKFAEQSVNEAENHLTKTSVALSQYRVKNEIFDVASQSESVLTLVQKLQNELISIQTQLDQVRALSPNNPQVKVLRARQKSIREELSQQLDVVFEGKKSLTTQSSEYQRLILDDTLAKQQLTAAMSALQSAKEEAGRQQLYLEIIAKPNRPDLALEPHRLYNILATLILGLVLYGVLTLLLAGVREHKN
ncbi:Vi polysaccharide export inner membrane protein VexD [uncultured Avibacterium sp.]|uniref:Vi polysaccharide export inner membrane protein VexD n=1 Tax=uncultured Avibacterium sp. TaxID=1936169 RepID=A0A486XGH5_9PAST|nr:Vi polysaccharide export inner membrane protein VexD [uncultured Avibacterium sp.]